MYLKQPLTILTSLHELGVLMNIVWSDVPEKPDVLVTMVTGHLLLGGNTRPLQKSNNNKYGDSYVQLCHK